MNHDGISPVGVGGMVPEPKVIRLCSSFDEYHELTCDLEKGHKGEHRATVLWGHDGDND